MKAPFLTIAASLLLLGACAGKPTPSATAGAGDGTGGNGGVSSQDLANSAVPGSQKDLELNVGDRVYFALNSSSIDDKSRATLEKQAAWLQRYPDLQVTVEGHTDETGTREYNLALGERRAVAAKNYLAALGVKPNRLLTISYGEEKPVDPGHDEAAYAKNRRAVTIVDATN